MITSSIFPTPFKLTSRELLISSAATIIFKTLSNSGRLNIPISEICEHPQYGYTATAQASAVGPRFVRITDLRSGKINWSNVPFCICDEPQNYVITKGDILVARAGSIGKSFLVSAVPEVAIFASYLIRLRVKSGILPDFVYWFFQSQQFWLQIASFDRGSAMSNINGKMLSALMLPEVAHNEQKAISNFLDNFSRKLSGENIELPDLPEPLENLPRVVLRVERMAVLIAEAQTFRREASEDAEALFAETTSHLPLSESVWTKISDVLSSKKGAIHSGPFGSDLTHDEFVEEGVAAIGTRDIKVNKFVLESGWHVTYDRFERLKQFQIFPGNVLVTIIGGSIGRFCVVPDDVPLAFTTKHVIAIQFDAQLIIPQYASYMLNFHSRCRKTMFAQTAGSAQPSLNSKKIKAIEIPVPQVDEQLRIVEYLNSLQGRLVSLRLYQKETQKELDALLPSVLDKAFKGEL